MSQFEAENACAISKFPENGSPENERKAGSESTDSVSKSSAKEASTELQKNMGSGVETGEKSNLDCSEEKTVDRSKLSSSEDQITQGNRELDISVAHQEERVVSNGVFCISGEEERSSAPFAQTATGKGSRPAKLDVPPSSQCETAQTDSDVSRKAPTEVMSPRSYSTFKNSLVHVPEMNLPWESMRKTSQCGCGVTFSFSTRKVGVY